MTTQMLGVRLTERDEKEIKKLVDAGLYVSVSEFIRDSVRKNLALFNTLEIRPISKLQARKEIMKYMLDHRESYASDISEELGIDLDLVFTIMKGLSKEGIVE